MTVLTLSRFQFALTVMFHYLFPPLTIGLGLLLVLMEGTYLSTGRAVYESMARFWTKIFGVNFALGVATGIVMEFEFGTNWATYSRYVGDVFGSALASEGIFAFFLESGFLAVLIFGWDRVSPRAHFFSTVMVFLGSMFSAVWIVVANSWQQTPAGFHIVGQGPAARAEIVDFWAMVFNPSSLPRLTHTVIGAFVLGAFFVMSISAFYILRGRHLEFARRSFSLALAVATLASVAQLVSGDRHAREVARYQPVKLAAFEGLFRTTAPGGAPLCLFGVVDEKGERVRGWAQPGLLSLLLYGDASKPVPALDQFPRRDWPPVAASFYCFHVMVALGVAFIALTLFGCYRLARGTLFNRRGLLWIFVFAVIGPFAANELGWVAAEVGRQPWVVYGLLRTSDALSKVVQANQVLGSIVMFVVIYLLLFAVWIYVLNRKIQKGPEEDRPPTGQTTAEGLLDAAGRLVKPAGYSLTETRDPEGRRSS